jgi:uncharacterized membrane protein
MNGISALLSGKQRPATCPQKNVGEVERYGSLFAGGLLLVNGLQRGRLPGLILTGLGASLIYRGYTGHCALYSELGISTRSTGNAVGVPQQAGFKFERSLTINRPANELFSFWRQLSNLPRIMRHLESVTETGGGRSHWVAQGPLGVRVEWDAEVHNEDPGRMIAWRSLPGSQVDTAGSVHFEQRSRGTEVRVSLKYNPPGGRLGAGIAWMMGQSVEGEIASDLNRFKQQMETGEIATATGQSSGSRT